MFSDPQSGFRCILVLPASKTIDFGSSALHPSTNDPGFSGNSTKFETTYLRAQEELEARETCVVTPGTWSKRRKNPIEKIFSQKNILSSITTTAKPKIRLHTPTVSYNVMKGFPVLLWWFCVQEENSYWCVQHLEPGSGQFQKCHVNQMYFSMFSSHWY